MIKIFLKNIQLDLFYQPLNNFLVKFHLFLKPIKIHSKIHSQNATQFFFVLKHVHWYTHWKTCNKLWTFFFKERTKSGFCGGKCEYVHNVEAAKGNSWSGRMKSEKGISPIIKKCAKSQHVQFYESCDFYLRENWFNKKLFNFNNLQN